MNALLLTNEYPPNVYGGAWVHVEYLSAALSRLMAVEVRCFGEQALSGQNPSVTGYGADRHRYTCPESLKPVFDAIERDLRFNTDGIAADVVHCHTWYTHLGGILAKLNYGIPLVVTVHSLEPLRPWKREQLGGGYDFSCWIEKTALEMADAVIAVSEGTRKDLERLFQIDPSRLHIIYNGIDPAVYRPIDPTAALRRHGIDPAMPYLLFVGRITRQKGIIHLVEAIRHFEPGFQVVLCAGAPDTPEIAAEMKQAVEAIQTEREGVFWIDSMVAREEVIELYSGASVFCCPSIYEPFGIINLEAMACETAVVGAHVGGIPEVVLDGETGLLVPLEEVDPVTYAPIDPARYARDLSRAINRLMSDEPLRTRMAKAGRKRVLEVFSWDSIAHQTHALYQRLQRT
jgi:starch synthase